MCFRVVFDKTIIGRLPGFATLKDVPFPEGDLSAFTFPLLPVLTAGDEGALPAGWGLIPRWVREGEKARKIRSSTVNARSETIHEKPSFRDSWPHKRCVLPVRGFFEPHLGEQGKETWRIERGDGDFFYLGGIYEKTSLAPESGFPGFTFSLLTLEATGFLAEVHNGKLRMPLVMTEEKALLWLREWERPAALFDSSWLMDQKELRGKITESDKKKSDYLKESSLFSIFN
ncbi:MAG: SOS response-associated peptidase [Spirochaetales bacterium]|nr:SOS response-associated peptidase [Spirochaetales bacterium]